MPTACRERRRRDDRALGARAFWPASGEGGQKAAPAAGPAPYGRVALRSSGDASPFPVENPAAPDYYRAVSAALTRRLCFAESGPEGPRTQRYPAGLGSFSTPRPGTVSLRAMRYPLTCQLLVESVAAATTVRWVRGPSGPHPAKAARKPRRPQGRLLTAESRYVLAAMHHRSQRTPPHRTTTVQCRRR